MVDAARVRHVRFVTGDTDIGTGDGLMMARIMAALAAKESANKSRRVTRKRSRTPPRASPTEGRAARSATSYDR